jgi:hypothetical protein
MSVLNRNTEGTLSKLVSMIDISAPLDQFLGDLGSLANGLGENTLVVIIRCARIGTRSEQDADYGQLIVFNSMVENGVAEVANVIHVAAQLDELGDERRTLEQVDGIQHERRIGHLVAIQTRDDGDLLLKRRVQAELLMGLVAHRALDHLLNSIYIVVDKTLVLDVLDGSKERINVRHLSGADERMRTATRHECETTFKWQDALASYF